MMALIEFKELYDRYGIEPEEVELIAKHFTDYLVPKPDDERREAATIYANSMAIVAIVFAANHPPK